MHIMQITQTQSLHDLISDKWWVNGNKSHNP